MSYLTIAKDFCLMPPLKVLTLEMILFSCFKIIHMLGSCFAETRSLIFWSAYKGHSEFIGKTRVYEARFNVCNFEEE